MITELGAAVRSRGLSPGPLPSAPGWSELATAKGFGLLARVDAERAAGSPLDVIGRRLRADGEDPDLIAAALTQSELRATAEGKFGAIAASLLFTRAGLEQATRAPIAALHADRFRAAGCRSVADLGCGLGAESLALIAAGLEPRPVELDPLTAAFAEHNLGVAAARAALPQPAVVCGDAEQLGPGDADGVFLDPARRTAGHRDTRRLVDPDAFSPSLRFAFGIAEERPTGVKLGPGLDHELIPAGAEAQWVSVDGQLVELGLWFGAAARAGIRRAALVVRGPGERAELVSRTGVDGAATPETLALGDYLYEPDGAIIRARLIGDLAERLGGGLIGKGLAYLTADGLVRTPFAQAFRVLEELPSREKDLRRALQARGIGSLEIKKRGADVDPAVLRKRLKLRGPRSATIVLTRVAGRHTTLLVERCTAERGAMPG